MILPSRWPSGRSDQGKQALEWLRCSCDWIDKAGHVTNRSGNGGEENRVVVVRLRIYARLIPAEAYRCCEVAGGLIRIFDEKPIRCVIRARLSYVRSICKFRNAKKHRG